MKSWIVKSLISPRLWLGLGALCMIGTFAVGYHQAQKAAEQVLALRSDPAPAVLLQDYGHDRHVTREVRVYAEVDPGAPVSVDFIGEDGAEESAVIYPLYPVSDIGYGVLARTPTMADAPQRPAERPGADGKKVALGFLVRHVASGGRDEQVAGAFGEGLGNGQFGRVMEITGMAVAPGNLSYVAQGAVAAMGGTLSAQPLAVRPFTRSRMEAVDAAAHSALAGGLTTAAIFCGLAAVALSIRHHVTMPRRRVVSRPRPDSRPVSTHRVFAPIATQDEIALADAEAAMRRYVSHPIVRIVEGAANEARDTLRAKIRSRRRRPVSRAP